MAMDAGFDDCGICQPYLSEKETAHYSQWLKTNFHGTMKYLENTEKRFFPEKVFQEIKSVIMLVVSYNSDKEQHENSFYKISKYAFGKDYHQVIKEKLTIFEKLLTSENNGIKTYSFVDSSSVWEKVWAKKCGIASTGKNTVMIHKNLGSFCFLGGVFTNAISEYDKEASDLCGSCRKCIEHCPTKALESDYCLDTRKCISYHTIENKKDLPQLNPALFKNYIYGCDICQNICPHNKNVILKNHFPPSNSVLNLQKNDWEKLDEDRFNSLFLNSAIHRIGLNRLKRNIDFINSI